MERRKLQTAAAAEREIVAQFDVVMRWPGLSNVEKLKWYVIWRNVCGGLARQGWPITSAEPMQK